MSSGESKESTIHSLNIVLQPPVIFANQQNGKNHGFVVKVAMLGPKLESAILKVELVYFDNLKKVSDQQPKKLGRKSKKNCRPKAILQLLQTSPFSDSKASFKARINDVSRNHHGRAFRLRVIACVGENEVASELTSAITVISKIPKISKKKKTERPVVRHMDACIAEHTPPAATKVVPSKKRRRCLVKGKTADETHGSVVSRTEHSESARVGEASPGWDKRAFLMIKKLEKRILRRNSSGQVITQCPVCFAVGNLRKICHTSTCILASLLKKASP